MSDSTASASQGTGVPAGIDPERVSAWFADNIPGVVMPLRFRLIAGGRSNLTFEVSDGGGGRYVLRRPPTGHLLPTAHDMAREYRIISALGPAGVPVAPALGLSTDDAVNGAPFYVMGFVDGIIARGEAEVEKNLDMAARQRTGLALTDTLAQIHGVDPDAVGLGDLGRKEDYIARQLRRWFGNYRAALESRGGDSLPDVDLVHDQLADRIPEQGPAAVVHGDYRLDNCVITPDGRMLAVLDWELCTLGDPLADLGQLMVYWPEPGEFSALGSRPPPLLAFRPERRLPAVTRRPPGGIWSIWTSMWRSVTGNWRASWRACTRVTSSAPWVMTGSTSAATRGRSPGWRRRPARP